VSTRPAEGPGATPEGSGGRREAEAVEVQVVKVLLLAGAAVLLGGGLATPFGLVAALVAIPAAAWAAHRLHTRGLRTGAALTLSGAVLALGWLGSGWVRDTGLAGLLGVTGAIATSDVLLFGVAFFGALLGVRFLAQRFRLASVIEAGLILLSVVYTFARHRDCRLTQPREFADAVFDWGLGDPSVLLIAMGVGLMVVALVMFMRRQRAGKAILSMVFAVGVGGGIYYLIEDDPICGAVEVVNEFAQSGDGEEDASPDQERGEGQGEGSGEGSGGGASGQQGEGGGGGGGGQRDNPFGSPPPPQDRPRPVAVVTFHDDVDAKEGILYFRQQVQSRYNGVHLTPDPTGTYDRDVITRFPTEGPVAAGDGQRYDVHARIPTSVYLLADHPQPIALGHASELRPLHNPDPRYFVGSYEAIAHLLTVDASRLIGRRSVPSSWDEAQRAHYLAIPDDPRYEALADIIVRDIDPRFGGDALMKALYIKRYLEKEGYYTLRETHADPSDPTASFLFGSLRGYCVHFAHAAVFLFRSQGIASRVAVGYGVDIRRRSGGSNLLIMANMAHAWPEIHLEGVGWVTFDIYPERSDELPQQIIDESLESLLGEIARQDRDKPWSVSQAEAFPWSTLWWSLLGLVFLAILTLYGVKVYRRLRAWSSSPARAHRLALRAALDGLADLGLVRSPGETRERFAARAEAVAPSLRPLTMANLRAALGQPGAASSGQAPRELYRQVRAELRARVPLPKRLAAALNPIGWCLVR